jgi:arylsulfatase A-like enzyme
MERRKPEPTGFMDRRLARQISFEEGDVAKIRANYAGRVALIDDQIAGILQAIEERGELDRTVIAFASEHGEMNGDHGLTLKKTFLNGAVRVPMLLRVPGRDGFAEGAVSSTPVELMDIGATFAALAGRRKPKQSRARSLVLVLKDPEHRHRTVVVSGLKKEIMVASTDWKMVLNQEGQPYVLVDLRHDPDETENLVGDPTYDEPIDDLLRTLQKFHPGLWMKLRRAREGSVG